ncbi:fluoride efflux transporter FluC [Limosilactobacillus caecicola]|uniref:fluoride efflux transporter FluC n=1 Tax=Limosilactobacillus caecicola TaxID=2941332 RepID=UPI002041059C|nr:CrcB family protein [Limosilactobacillus caecicola]
MIIAGCGAAIGALLRYLTTSLWKLFRIDWPFATLIINLSGSFILSLLIHQLQPVDPRMTFWGVGVLGGFTTFSTFNTELISLIDERKWFTLITYFCLSYGGGISLAFFGFLL